MNSTNLPTTSTTHTKDRLYAQLAQNIARMTRAVGHTADLLELLQVDLKAMRELAGGHAAQLVTVAAELNPVEDEPVS